METKALSDDAFMQQMTDHDASKKNASLPIPRISDIHDANDTNDAFLHKGFREEFEL
jgi:hypothetical protein